MRNNFPKRQSGAPLHTLSKLYDVPVGFVTIPLFWAVYCFNCGRRRVAVARYRMICLVLLFCVSYTNINPRYLFYLNIYLSLAPFTLDECTAWFHSYGLRRSVWNGKQAKNSKWKYVSTCNRTSDPHFPSLTESDKELCLKLLHNQGIYKHINKIKTWQYMCQKGEGIT